MAKTGNLKSVTLFICACAFVAPGWSGQVAAGQGQIGQVSLVALSFEAMGQVRQFSAPAALSAADLAGSRPELRLV